MSAQAPIKTRSVLIALALGAAPALIAPWTAPGLLGTYDLLVSGIALALLVLAGWLPVTAVAVSERALLACAITVAAAASMISARVLDAPVSNDEAAYLLQADLFAAGRISQEIPQPAEAFRRRQVYEDAENGVRFAKYPPGASLALAVGAVIGLPALSTLLAGVLGVLLMAAIGRNLGLPRPGLLALLLAVSPFFLLVQASYQSQVFTLSAALAGYLALLRGRRADRARSALGWGVLLGVCAGWVFLCRPLTGVAFAAACGAGALGASRRGSVLSGAVLGGLPLASLFLLFNLLWTGDAWQTPYDLYARTFGPFRPDGSPVDVYGHGEFLPMLMDQAGRWSIAFAGVLGAVALGFWGLFRARARDGGAALLFAALLPLAYAFHWYPGHWAYLGPLYCFESLGLLICGAWLLVQEAPVGLRRAFVLIALIAGPAAAFARWPAIVKESGLRSLPERLARELTPPGAVILLPPNAQGFDSSKLWSPSRAPGSAEERVLLRTLPQLSLSALLDDAGLRGRPVYRFLPDQRGGGRLEQASPTP